MPGTVKSNEWYRPFSGRSDTSLLVAQTVGINVGHAQISGATGPRPSYVFKNEATVLLLIVGSCTTTMDRGFRMPCASRRARDSEALAPQFVERSSTNTRTADEFLGLLVSPSVEGAGKPNQRSPSFCKTLASGRPFISEALTLYCGWSDTALYKSSVECPIPPQRIKTRFDVLNGPLDAWMASVWC